MRNQLFAGEVSCQQISCIKLKNISNKQTQQQIVITKCLCDHYSGFYTDTLTKSMKVACLDPMHHIRTKASELKEQKDRRLDSENELICRKCEHGASVIECQEDCTSKFQRCRE
jgi:hypothetical protein